MFRASMADTTASMGTSQSREIFRFKSSEIEPVAAADDHVRLDPPAAQLGDPVLGRLGLLLPRWSEVGHEREVDVADVVAPDVPAELADGLEEGHDLDVAHRAPDLDDDHVDVLGAQLRIRSLISSVTWGMTCTVLPR